MFPSMIRGVYTRGTLRNPLPYSGAESASRGDCVYEHSPSGSTSLTSTYLSRKLCPEKRIIVNHVDRKANTVEFEAQSL